MDDSDEEEEFTIEDIYDLPVDELRTLLEQNTVPEMYLPLIKREIAEREQTDRIAFALLGNPAPPTPAAALPTNKPLTTAHVKSMAELGVPAAAPVSGEPATPSGPAAPPVATPRAAPVVARTPAVARPLAVASAPAVAAAPAVATPAAHAVPGVPQVAVAGEPSVPVFSAPHPIPPVPLPDTRTPAVSSTAVPYSGGVEYTPRVTTCQLNARTPRVEAPSQTCDSARPKPKLKPAQSGGKGAQGGSSMIWASSGVPFKPTPVSMDFVIGCGVGNKRKKKLIKKKTVESEAESAGRGQGKKKEPVCVSKSSGSRQPSKDASTTASGKAPRGKGEPAAGKGGIRRKSSSAVEVGDVPRRASVDGGKGGGIPSRKGSLARPNSSASGGGATVPQKAVFAPRKAPAVAKEESERKTEVSSSTVRKTAKVLKDDGDTASDGERIAAPKNVPVAGGEVEDKAEVASDVEGEMGLKNVVEVGGEDDNHEDDADDEEGDIAGECEEVSSQATESAVQDKDAGVSGPCDVEPSTRRALNDEGRDEIGFVESHEGEITPQRVTEVHATKEMDGAGTRRGALPMLLPESGREAMYEVSTTCTEVASEEGRQEFSLVPSAPQVSETRTGAVTSMRRDVRDGSCPQRDGSGRATSSESLHGFSGAAIGTTAARSDACLASVEQSSIDDRPEALPLGCRRDTAGFVGVNRSCGDAVDSDEEEIIDETEAEVVEDVDDDDVEDNALPAMSSVEDVAIPVSPSSTQSIPVLIDAPDASSECTRTPRKPTENADIANTETSRPPLAERPTPVSPVAERRSVSDYDIPPMAHTLDTAEQEISGSHSSAESPAAVKSVRERHRGTGERSRRMSGTPDNGEQKVARRQSLTERSTRVTPVPDRRRGNDENIPPLASTPDNADPKLRKPSVPRCPKMAAKSRGGYCKLDYCGLEEKDIVDYSDFFTSVPSLFTDPSTGSDSSNLHDVVTQYTGFCNVVTQFSTNVGGVGGAHDDNKNAFSDVFLRSLTGGTSTENKTQAECNTRFYKVVQHRTEVYDIVTRALHRKVGWEEMPHGLGKGAQLWNLMWTWSKPRVEHGKLCAWQKVNHYPENKHLTRKDTLKRCVDRYARSGSRSSSFFYILPKTFVLPKEYVLFVEAFAQQEEKKDEPNLWIMKPAVASRGRGIQVIDDVQYVSYGELTVIQQYVSRPLLLGGYKWDLRVYVLVTSFQPLEAFFYKDGFARFATVPYSLESDELKNKFVHLTNTSVNRLNKDVDMTDDALLGGTKINFATLQKKLAEINVSWTMVWNKMLEVVLKSLVMSGDHIPHQVNSFELFGYDIIFDDKLTAWLIEVNSSPSLGLEHLLDEQVKIPLIDDTLDVISPLKFDREALIKCLKRGERDQKQLNIDLTKILGGEKPRKYGEIPDKLGNFHPIAPSKTLDHIMKMRAQLFNKK